MGIMRLPSDPKLVPFAFTGLGELGSANCGTEFLPKGEWQPQELPALGLA